MSQGKGLDKRRLLSIAHVQCVIFVFKQRVGAFLSSFWLSTSSQNGHVRLSVSLYEHVGVEYEVYVPPFFMRRRFIEPTVVIHA